MPMPNSMSAAIKAHNIVMSLPKTLTIQEAWAKLEEAAPGWFERDGDIWLAEYILNSFVDNGDQARTI